MYSLSTIPVDKGLGFDFSDITDFVKTAATTGLNVYKQQMQMKQVKALAQANVQTAMPYPNGIVPANQYGMYNTILSTQAPYMQQTNLPQPMMMRPQSGIDTSTVLLTGGLVVGGIMLFKLLKG